MPVPPAQNSVNLDNARAAWGGDLPRWVAMLATACDRTNQRAVADVLGVSGGYVSRLLNRKYAGSYPEAERLVLARFSSDTVDCPLAGAIALRTCIRNRRRKTPAVNFFHRQFDARCPSCPHNNDVEED